MSAVPDEADLECPRCETEIEDAAVIPGVGLVIWPCGHVYQ